MEQSHLIKNMAKSFNSKEIIEIKSVKCSFSADLQIRPRSKFTGFSYIMLIV